MRATAANAPVAPGVLETRLRARRDAGAKLLVPYVTGGLGDWCRVLEAVADAGADAVEVGIPFSDPVMDGPVIQRASAQALAAGATPEGIVAELGRLQLPIPVAVMTYYNIVFHAGHTRMASRLAEAGVAAAIVPDLPLAEVGEWADAADRAGVETVMLAAPTTPDDRLDALCRRSRGFVYAVGLMGVTGERDTLADTAIVIAERLRRVTDKPVLVGVGISNAEQAVQASAAADGVVIGSALVRRLLEGGGPTEAGDFVASVRVALDRAYPPS